MSEAAPDQEGQGKASMSTRVPSLRWVFKAAVLAAVAWFLVGGFFALLTTLSELLSWIVIALFASFALEPAVAWLARRGWRRGLATGLVLVALLVALVAMVALMVPLMVEQVQALVRAAPDLAGKVSELLDRWIGVKISVDDLTNQLSGTNTALSDFAGNIAGRVFGFATSIIGSIFMLLTIGLFTFYLTADGPRLRRQVCSFLPADQQERVLWVWEVAIDKTGAFLYSRLLLALFSAISTFVVLSVAGVPFALPLAVWMGIVSQFIPTLGTYIAMALPLLVTLGEKGALGFVLLLGYFTAYQQVENYLLSPRITAKTMNLHPALAFGLAVAGALIWGFKGALLALPLAAIVQAVTSTAVQRHTVADTELTHVDGPGDSRKRRDDRKSGETQSKL